MKSVDCACVIHGDYYDWQYVERLYNMLSARCDRTVNLHVYTEAERQIPDYMIKHELMPWPGITGPRRSWWYKMQLFNSEHFSGQLFYLDLDTVIVNNIDWIWDLPADQFHAIRDFRNLQRPTWTGINSSLMLWNTQQFHWIWDTFLSYGPEHVIKTFRGDQDFLSELLVKHACFNYLDRSRIHSWRWQVHRGGIDFTTGRTKNLPTRIDPTTSFLIFHGNPKPHQISDPVIRQLWR
jgi:hypothetical protein